MDCAVVLNVSVYPLSDVTSMVVTPPLAIIKSLAREVVGLPTLSRHVMVQETDIPARAGVVGLLQWRIDDVDGAWYT